MTSTEKDASFYIRIRGRVLGPYTIKQLNTLWVRGQFSQSNEISTDGKTWEAASTLEAVFGTPPAKSRTKGSDSSVVVPPARSDGAAAPWHYSIDGEQHGPATLAELHEMLEAGRLNLRDLVWKEGMAEWAPASEIEELNSVDEFKPRSRASNKRRKPDQSVTTSENALAPHFLDNVLYHLRSGIGQSFISAVGPDSVELGRYAIYVSIILNLAFGFVIAVKLNSMDIGLLGIGFAAVALVLQYSAIKSSGAIMRLIRATTLRMSSTAFIDSMVVLLLVGGMVVLISTAIIWIRTQEIPSLIGGIAVFLLCEQLGLMLMQPDAIGITVSDRVSPGEEAIAILSFFLMIPLRFVPTVFGVGSVLSIFGTCGAFYFLLLAKSPGMSGETPEALFFAIASAALALQCAAFPFVMYVYFVIAYLFIDVIRCILMLPDKVDQLPQRIAMNREDISNHGERGQRLVPETVSG